MTTRATHMNSRGLTRPVALMGPSGVGKSHLIRELTRTDPQIQVGWAPKRRSEEWHLPPSPSVVEVEKATLKATREVGCTIVYCLASTDILNARRRTRGLPPVPGCPMLEDPEDYDFFLDLSVTGEALEGGRAIILHGFGLTPLEWLVGSPAYTLREEEQDHDSN